MVFGANDEAHGGRRFPIGKLDLTQKGQLLYKTSVGGSLTPASSCLYSKSEATWAHC